MRLKERAALITGGAQGIGRAAALAFAREGADVIVSDIDIEGAQATARQVRDLGRTGIAMRVDVCDRASVDAAVKAGIEAFGKLDILFNPAGNLRINLLQKMTRDEWQSVIDVHLTGNFNCLQAIVGHFIERKYGKYIVVTSPAGIDGTVGQINYSTAKAGLLGFIKAAALELARYNVCVNAINPIAVTRMTDKVRSDPKLNEIFLSKIPMRRWAEVDEITPSLVFLASDEANYITGHTLAVNGGRTMHS